MVRAFVQWYRIFRINRIFRCSHCGWSEKTELRCFLGPVGRELTEEIIGAAYAVHNGLGPGFLEKVYKNALAVELRMRGIAFGMQMSLGVKYRGEPVGEYFADMIVESVTVRRKFRATRKNPVNPLLSDKTFVLVA